MADRHLLSLSTLVSQASWSAFYATRHQVYSRFDIDDMTIWYHTYKQMHTTLIKTNRLTHKYILATPITYSQQLSVLHWINHSLTLKINFMKVNNILIFQKSLIEEAAYLLIRFNKTKSFLWNTSNTDRNCVNEQKKHTPHTKREITLEKVSMRISDTPFF